MRPFWYPEWAGETIVIVASGPSAKNVPLELGKGKARFIAINRSWELCPWADVLYSCDTAWWIKYKGCPEFPGLKITIDARACDIYPDLRRLICSKADDRMEFTRLGAVGWGGNSGFNAYNFAVQLDPAKIVLVGYDMTLSHGMHWHGPHHDGLNNPKPGNVDRWRRCVDGPWKLVAERGIRVINCSPISTLRKYEKMTFAAALAS